MKKGGFMKDAWILFAITLISGLLLGAVYQITKVPIQMAEAKESLHSIRLPIRMRWILYLIRRSRIRWLYPKKP